MNKFFKFSIILLSFINLKPVQAEDINTGKIVLLNKLKNPTKILCKKAGYPVSIQCPNNIESLQEDAWKSANMGFNLQDTVTVNYEDDEYFYLNKKIQGGLVVYRFPKESFASEPPPKNLKKYFLGKRKTLYISKEPSKSSQIIDSLKGIISVFCYEDGHKETEDGYWIKITTGDWTDSASIRWIYTKDLDSLDLSAPPVCLNAKEIIEYPGGLRIDGVEGKVITELWVDEKGNVRQVIIKKSTHPGLSKAAEKSAYKLKFKPALRYSKKPISVWLIFPIKYYLQ